jgi:hypothetical protein
MPTKYLLPMSNLHPNQDFCLTHILSNHMVELEHLDETNEETTDWIGTRQWNTTLWAQQNHKIKIFSMGDTVFGFQRVKRNTLKSFKIGGLVRLKYNIVSPTILYYLSTLTSLNQIPFW